MTSFLDPLITFVSAHPWLAYLTLFLAALLEAVPVVGSLVPGSTLILALSALIPGGELKLWGVLALRRRGRTARRRHRLTGSAIAASAKSSAPGRWPIIRAWSRRARRSSTLGRARGVFCPFRAADPRLCPGHGRRARHVAAALLQRQHSRQSCSGRPRMCCPACWRFPRCMNMPDCRIMSMSASICGCWRCSAAV